MDTTTEVNPATDANLTPPSSASPALTTTTIVIIVFEVLVAVLSIFGNSMVLIVIAKERRLRNATNYCVASLATADFLVGALGIPCVLVSLFGIPTDFYGCLIVNIMIIVLTQISVFSLLVIALERFMAIRFPFKYKANCTDGKVAIVIATSWIAGIAVGLLPTFGLNMKSTYTNNFCSFLDVIDLQHIVYLNFFGCVLTPLALMIGIYMYIFHVVRTQICQIAALQISHTAEPKSSNDQCETQLGRQRKSLASESRSAKWFAVVLALFVICWLPIHIMNTVSLIHQKTNVFLLNVAIILSHGNSAMNPVLYAYANTKFKNAFKRLLHLEKCACWSDAEEDGDSEATWVRQSSAWVRQSSADVVSNSSFSVSKLHTALKY